MNSKNIFIMYGIIDIMFFVFVIGWTIAKKLGLLYISLILMYLPNVALFILVLTADSINTRMYYQKWLRFKLVFMGFVLPLVFLHQAESHWEAAICSRILNQEPYNVGLT